MWVKVSRKGDTVMMGFSGTGYKESIIKVFDTAGELVPDKDFAVENQSSSIPQAKISFHSTGKYKLTTKAKIKKYSSDRVTVQGLPFNDINKYTRMAEILLPTCLLASESKHNELNDIIFNLDEFPRKPLRCTISCMPKCDFERYFKDGNFKIVDTSTCEASAAIEIGNLIWVWTLRTSSYDNHATNKQFIIFIFGKILWPGHKYSLLNNVLARLNISLFELQRK
jgi:hypothetical protein